MPRNVGRRAVNRLEHRRERALGIDVRARRDAEKVNVGKLPGRVVVGIRTALEEFGICSALTATPLERLAGDQRRQASTKRGARSGRDAK